MSASKQKHQQSGISSGAIEQNFIFEFREEKGKKNQKRSGSWDDCMAI
jgi:hypothetical protein